MTHDPLCPDSDPNRWVSKDFNGNSMSCRCEEYAKIREDERDNCWSAVAELSATEFWEEVLGRPTKWWVVKADALAAIEALKEKP